MSCTYKGTSAANICMYACIMKLQSTHFLLTLSCRIHNCCVYACMQKGNQHVLTDPSLAAKNPAGAFDETELTQQAQTIGTPINNFFSTPNVSMVTPSAITIPQGQVYTGAATTLSISLLLVLALALLISA